MNMTDAPGRTYRYYTGTPLYEFGYGLSYTTFEIKWISHEPKQYILQTTDNLQVTYTVQITNTGKVLGDEVVFAYIQPNNNTQPLIKQLFGFQRVQLDIGKSTTISFTLNKDIFKIGNEDGDLLISPGEYNIIFTNGVEETLMTKISLQGPELVVEKYPF